MNEELSEYNYDQNPEKPKRGIAKSKSRGRSPLVWIVGIGALLATFLCVVAVAGVMLLGSDDSSTTVQSLVNDINTGHVEGLEHHDSDNNLKIHYTGGTEGEITIGENIDSIPEFLMLSGAEEEAIHQVKFTYSGGSSIQPFILGVFGLGIAYYAMVILILYKIPNRVENEFVRLLWVGFILLVPVWGLVAYILVTRKTVTLQPV